MNKNKKFLYGILIVLGIALIISLLIGAFSSLTYLESFRIVFGSIYVLFIPGFIISYIFFPKTSNTDFDHEEKKSIDWLERIALSFALSIAIVPLTVFYLNLIGLKISLINSFITILVIIIVSFIILMWRNKKG